MAEDIGINTIEATGYSFLMEMIYYCEKNHFKIKEVPIHFGRRNHGKSKISQKEVNFTIKTLIKLSFKRLIRVQKNIGINNKTKGIIK